MYEPIELQPIMVIRQNTSKRQTRNSNLAGRDRTGGLADEYSRAIVSFMLYESNQYQREIPGFIVSFIISQNREGKEHTFLMDEWLETILTFDYEKYPLLHEIHPWHESDDAVVTITS